MTKLNKNTIKTYSELPDGFEEFPQSLPPTAVGKGKVLHKCSSCGWVEGSPVLEPQNVPWPNDGNRQPMTLHRCRKCNKILAKTGDAMGGRIQ
jgi:hypothetical protein